MNELLHLAHGWQQCADDVRSRAHLVRSARAVTWEGPGATNYHAVVEDRSNAMTAIADRMDALAGRLRGLAALERGA